MTRAGTRSSNGSDPPSADKSCSKVSAVPSRACATLVALCVAATLAVGLSSGGDANATLPGANGKIAYVSTEVTNTTQIFATSLGGAAEQLTYGETSTGGHGARWDPAWSPDGTKLAYAHWLWGSSTVADIYVLDEIGGPSRRLTSDPGWESDPAWSPDGRRIAFSNTGEQFGGQSDRSSIWLIDAGGGQPALLHTNGFAPAWSPDGSRIAFVATTASGTLIYVMNADGSAPRALTPGVGPPSGSGPDLAPDWSPDGASIVFLSRRSGTWEVWKIDSDGSDLQQLTNGGRSGGDEEDPGFDPVFSPDGTKIAYGHDSTGQFTLSVMNADGTGQTTVAPLAKVGSNWVGMPTWQPTTDLSVRVTFPQRAKAGSRVTLTGSVRNTSSLAARNVVARVTLRGTHAQTLAARISRGSCTVRPRPRCTIRELAAGASARLSLVLKTHAPGMITAGLTVRSSTAEATPETNSASARTRVR